MKNLALYSVCLVLSAAASFGAGTYIGGGVGYWLDSEDPIFSARFGMDIARQNTLTHSLEIEGYTGKDSHGETALRLNGLLANYKLSADLNESLYLSAGGGLGATRARFKYFNANQTDTAFTYQLLAALGYRLTPQLSVEAGVRYLNVGKAEFFGHSDKIGDDTSIELGLKYHF